MASSTNDDQTWENVKRRRNQQLEMMQVADLKALCRDTGLRVGGKKAELIARCSQEMQNKYALTMNRFTSQVQKTESLSELKRMLQYMDKIKERRSDPTSPANTRNPAARKKSTPARYNPPPPPVALGRNNFKHRAPMPPPQPPAPVNQNSTYSSNFSSTSASSVTTTSTTTSSSTTTTTFSGPVKYQCFSNIRLRTQRYPEIMCTALIPSTCTPFDSRSFNTNLLHDLHRFLERLQSWDPFNHISSAHAPTALSRTAITASINPGSFRVTPASSQPSRKPLSIAVLHFQHVAPAGLRYIVRCLPKAPKKDKPDVHLWPKGTQLFVNGQEIANLKQRRQQSHDASLWKGMSHPLDITNMVMGGATNSLVLLSEDEEEYAVMVSIVEVWGNTNVKDELARRAAGDALVTVKESMEKAKDYARAQSVVLLDDEGGSEGGEQEDEIAPTNLSLLDPVGKVLIETPVLGKGCKHVQCFDLGVFVSMNAYPSARRWACPACERFTAPGDLRVSELFVKLLEEYKRDAKGNEAKGVNQVKLEAGRGTWTLTGGKVNSKKRKARSMGGEVEPGGDGAAEVQKDMEKEEQELERRLSLTPPEPVNMIPAHEVIEIDSD